jgi:hypothetical protein
MRCEICGQEATCTVAIYRESPFVDGKFHDTVCLTCSSVPNTYEYNEDTQQLDVYRHISPLHINSYEQLAEQGFSKVEAKPSIDSVQGLIKDTFLVIDNQQPFEALYLLLDEPIDDAIKVST